MPKHTQKYRFSTRGKVLAGAALTVLILLLMSAISLFGKGTIQISLKGEPEILLRYGEDYYEEPGAEAFFRGKLFSSYVNVPVTVEGAPGKYAEPGIYTVVYRAAFRGRYEAVKTRIVTIRDLTPPVIVLDGAASLEIGEGETYQEEGYHAFDRYDGDLTAQVSRSVGDDGSIYYRVTDAAGNTAEVKREIRCLDTQAPVIRLNGAEQIILRLGENYSEPGATASDTAEGDVSARIRITGEVDTSREGVYVLTYTVADRAGNTAQVQRSVTVTANPGSTVSGAVIHLTFDDGPGPYTEALLDLLKKYDVKATFFVTNQRPEYRSLIAREAAEGHSVGIHSASHSYDIYASEETYFADINLMRDIIIEQTGKAPDIIRFIGGASTTKANSNPGIISRLAVLLEQQGYAYFDWNVSTGDGNFSISTQDAYNNAINGISQRSNSVVLMHDLNKNSMAAVEDIIKWGQANGYTFLPLTHDSPVCHHRISN